MADSFISTMKEIKEFGSCLWDAVSSRNLEENLKSLKGAMESLKKVYEDVKQRVEIEGKVPQMKCTNEVSGWLYEVLKLEKDVSKTLQDGEKEKQNKCLRGYCQKNCWSSYNLRNTISEHLDEVKKLRTLGQFNAVVQKFHVTVQQLPMVETVGLDAPLQDVWRCIEDRKLGIVGLYGIPGVGKTTLLYKINNEFLNVSHDFDEVILVSVSKLSEVELVQKKIMDKLDLPRNMWSSDGRETNAQKIFERLHGKKFLLLLDDIWQQLDLNLVGVPLPNDRNQSKVVFTTHSIDVCGLMEAQQKIEVKSLGPEEALHLFRMKVGEATLTSGPEISKLANDMAAKLNGLPLALVTVGRAMASRNDQCDWESGLNVLRNTPSQFPHMEGRILKNLKFSYDRLQSTTDKSCFLYCCLFPENSDIRKEKIINCWIGEGFIDELNEDADINGDLRSKGELVIRNLKRACLLGSGESEEFIRMHGMLRDMAWHECKEDIVLLIKKDKEQRGLRSWNKVKRMSLWDHSIQDLLTIVPHSSREDLLENISPLPNLLTMICMDPMSTTLHAGFFPSMSSLGVLDLSNSSSLHDLPKEIGHLINLKCLNLSNTAIPELPSALQNLRKLRCLILNCTKIRKIPRAMIPNFLSLEVFSKLEVLQHLDPGGFLHRDDYLQYLLKELECLLHIKEICIVIHEATSLQKLLESHKLLGCIRKLTLDECNDLPTLELSPSLVTKMEDLELRYCKELREISLGTGQFRNLSKVVIKGCNLSDVGWLIYAPRLQTLELVNCELLGEIIGDTPGGGEIEENTRIFSSLLVLRLFCLPSLQSIYRHALPFPSLIKIEVQDCELLTKLPFSKSATKTLKLISGEESWWDSLSWDDETIKEDFSPKFVERIVQNAWLEDFQPEY
ncbi:disease resistance protein SUMM2-like [Quercus robur]|uniref:disease resistance protein SUMM2-like n=1 Tax=Quercus robur TaxID=38942 RepID=UPI0021616C42|nr:disease resistance protein SUMM2-like [Quercus robur]